MTPMKFGRQLLAVAAIALAGTAHGASVYKIHKITLQTSSVAGEYNFGGAGLTASVCHSCGIDTVTDDGFGNLTVSQLSYTLAGFGANFTNTFSGTATLGTGTSLLKAGETCVVHNTAVHLCNPADQRSFAGDWLTGTLADGVSPALTHIFSATVSGNNLVLSFRTNRDASPINDPDWLQLNFKYALVPVPAAVWLFGSALGILGLARRRITSA